MPESNNSICILSPPMQLSNRCRVRALKSFFPLSPDTSGNHFIQSNPREIHRPHAESVLHYHIKNHPRVVAIVPDDDWVYSPSRGLLRLLRRVPFSLTDCLRVASERERERRFSIPRRRIFGVKNGPRARSCGAPFSITLRRFIVCGWTKCFIILFLLKNKSSGGCAKWKICACLWSFNF